MTAVSTYPTARLLAEIAAWLRGQGLHVVFDSRRLADAHQAATELLAALGVVAVTT